MDGEQKTIILQVMALYELNVTLWCISSPIENVVTTVEVQILIFGVPL